MVQVIWTEPALDDLDDIAEYIALSNIDAAKLLVSKVFESVDRLGLFPESGRKPPEIQEFSYREVVVKPCRVFYKCENNNVYILHVLRQERDVRRYLIESAEKG